MKNDRHVLTKKLSGVVFAALVLGGCATPAPTISTGPSAEVTFDGLHEIQNSAADKAWAAPDLDLAGYSKIMFQGAGIEYRPGGEAGRTMAARSRGGPYEVTDDQKTRFRKVVKDVLVEELGKSSNFTLVNESGPDVLMIRAALLDVISYVPPERTGRSDIYLSSVGEATLVLEIRDSITEAVLVRAIDRDAIENIGGMMSSSNRVTNTSDVKRVVRRWMSTLTTRLDEFSGFTNAE